MKIKLTIKFFLVLSLMATTLVAQDKVEEKKDSTKVATKE